MYEEKSATEVAAALERYAVEYRANVDADYFLRARKVVVDYFLEMLNRGSRVLDINCGTGRDAIEIARHGHEVQGVDISSGMISFAVEAIRIAGLSGRASAEVCDYTSLPIPAALFDAVLSNFGGINFASDLNPVFKSVGRSLRGDGIFLVNSVSHFSLIEFLDFLLKGKPASAFRRLGGGNARIGGREVRLYYHTRNSFASTARSTGFQLIDSFGLNIFAPPLWADDFFRSYRKLSTILEGFDGKIRRLPLLRSIGDFTIYVFRKTGAR